MTTTEQRNVGDRPGRADVRRARRAGRHRNITGNIYRGSGRSESTSATGCKADHRPWAGEAIGQGVVLGETKPAEQAPPATRTAFCIRKAGTKPVGYSNGIEADAPSMSAAEIGWNGQMKFEAHDLPGQTRRERWKTCSPSCAKVAGPGTSPP